MANLLNVIINATTISALYALVAIGFTLIFGVGGVLNFAHGALITVGAFGSYIVSNQMGLHPFFGMLAGTIATAAIGAAMYKGAIQYIEDQPVTLSILTFVFGFALAHAFRIFVSSGTVTVSQVVSGRTNLLGQDVQNISLVIFVLSWAIIVSVFYFVNRTKTGQAILATSMTKKGAALVGVKSKQVNLIVWVMAAAFAGLAGTLLVMKQGGSWNMGTSPLILAFSIVILGGLGSIRGSVVGAYVIGFVETFTTSFIDTRLTGLASLVLLIAFLLAKPEGLFGREAAE
ncbi:branched-chain amino acid ABC transporter permease [Halorarius litoreus]|uniref:branched-chain amino acid ABC transporter permease n=1 Tax=Halorarius litoreus TaxID=2962676 RepID=UPI0020CE0388|nr:branched-chain amino acid ABC transporter permease [Halorarius litoreus]